MDLCIHLLTLEITRRCNMQCKHCLRGQSEAFDMEKETVDRILDDVSSIGQLFFSGGEPSLNIPLIRYVFSEIIRRGIQIGSFGLITNGKENQMELASVILEGYAMLPLDEPECCYIAMSKDQFHDPNIPNLMKAFSFYSSDHEYKERAENTLIARGRAKEIAGAREKNYSEMEADVYDQFIEASEVYITARGDVVSDCDLSYDLQKDYSMGNVKTRSLKEMILEYAREQQGEIA